MGRGCLVADGRAVAAEDARQAHERTSALVERLQRRAGELTERLSWMPLCPDMTRNRFASVF
jgi:hypothetical protein